MAMNAQPQTVPSMPSAVRALSPRKSKLYWKRPSVSVSLLTVRVVVLFAPQVASAGLDVVYTEPIRADNPLLKAKNCIITPHISWAAKQCRVRILEQTVENVKAFLAGKPVNVVNL